MHELTIAHEILDTVLHAAAEHQAVQVKTVRLRRGIHSHLDPHSLTFCLEALAQDTILQGASFDIQACEADVECPACGRFPLVGKMENDACPRCGGPALRKPPTEIYIQELVLDVEDDRVAEESTIEKR